MSSTLPRIMHGDSIAGHGWRLSDALWEEAEYTIDDLAFHTDDLPMVHNHYGKQLERMQTEFLLKLVDSDLAQVVIDVLKRFELISLQLPLVDIDTPILDRVSGGELVAKQQLAAEWVETGGGWLDAVAHSEKVLNDAKSAVLACVDDVEMWAIVEGFPSVLSEVLQ